MSLIASGLSWLSRLSSSVIVHATSSLLSSPLVSICLSLSLSLSLVSSDPHLTLSHLSFCVHATSSTHLSRPLVSLSLRPSCFPDLASLCFSPAYTLYSLSFSLSFSLSLSFSHTHSLGSLLTRQGSVGAHQPGLALYLVARRALLARDD